jgi:DNA-binding NarL/FixJ family response regulator
MTIFICEALAMVIIAEMNVLTVGVENRTSQFKGLPIRLLNLAHGSEAIRSFKTDPIDSVVSHWHLADMPDGQFLRKLKAVKPDMPTVAIVDPNNPQQEIEARQLGVSAVIPEDCDSGYFRQVMAAVFGLPNVEAIENLYAVAEL